MIELVIFDCDGVLVDSEPIALRFEADRIARYGWRITPAEIVELFVGRSDSFVREAVAQRTGRALGPEWDAAVQDEFWPALERDLEPVDGIVDALIAVDDHGFRNCVASSGSHEKMRFTLGRTGLWDRFEGRIFSASEVARGKPAPDLFLHAASKMRAQPCALCGRRGQRCRRGRCGGRRYEGLCLCRWRDAAIEAGATGCDLVRRHARAPRASCRGAFAMKPRLLLSRSPAAHPAAASPRSRTRSASRRTPPPPPVGLRSPRSIHRPAPRSAAPA